VKLWPQSSSAPTRAQSPATLEVSVIDSTSGEPISNAQIVLIAGGGALPNLETSDPSAPTNSNPRRLEGTTTIRAGAIPASVAGRTAISRTTESNGKAIFAGVIPDFYRLLVLASGFVTQEYGKAIGSTSGAPLGFASNENKTIQLRLHRSSTIKGTIGNVGGGTLQAAAPVYLVLPVINENNQRDLQLDRATVTNPQGEFQFSDIAPGRYLIAAGRSSYSQSPYELRYYPRATNPDEAVFVNVSPGSSLTAVDMELTPASIRRIEGRIEFITTATATTPPTLSVYEVDPFQPRRRSVSTVTTRHVTVDGKFDLALPDGSYAFAVKVPNNLPRQLTPGSLNDAEFLISVDGANLTGLILRMSEAASVRGRLLLNDGSVGSLNFPTGAQPQLLFKPVQKIQPDGFAFIAPDGSFTMKGILGQYRISVPSSNLYISEIRQNGEVLRGGVVNILPGSVSDIQVTVRSDAGTVFVQVSEPSGKISANIALPAVLLADPLASNFSFLRFFSTRADGSPVAVQNVPPGNYRVFVGTGLRRDSYLDPATLDRISQHATPVSVLARSQVSVKAKIIADE
jgi:hypothetical protein